MSSSVPVTINDLPPEVLEKVIERLDDRASVLNCRLVNSEWNSATGKVLENLCLSIWTRWNPEEIRDKTPFPVIKRNMIFPFPTRSLCFDQFGWKEYKKTNKAAKVETFQLLKLFGSHLTSLWIEDMSLDPVQISIMFKQLVNLKALTIYGRWKLDAPAELELTAKPPPNLQYLRLKGVTINLAQWIVDQCSNQLISLETNRPSEYGNQRSFLKLPSSSGTTHLGFTKLKLCRASSDFFEQTVRLPLTHLSIDFPYDPSPSPREITLKNIITFLNNFSGTLVQLYLRVLLDKREDGGIIPFNEFPRLTKLFIRFLLPTDPDKNRLTYLHEVFLKRFPNLQCLQLMNCDMYGEAREMEQVREELDSRFLIQNCFQLCQKLETVTVSEDVADGDSRRRQYYEITVSRDGNQLWKLLQ